FPPMIGGIFYEHGHRMIAGTVAVLTILLAIVLWRVEGRKWVRLLGLVALGCVLLQATLGGLTVIYLLPPAISVAHACLAQIFFCITLVLSAATSPSWDEVPPLINSQEGRGSWLAVLAPTLTVLFFTQLL